MQHEQMHSKRVDELFDAASTEVTTASAAYASWNT